MKKICMMMVAGAAVVLSGCTTMKGGEFDVSIKSSGQVQVTNVSVHRDDGELHVTGTLRPVSAATTRAGHVDVDFIGPDGNILKTVKAVPHTKTFSRNSARRPSFSVEVELDQVSAVRLTHHADTMQQCEN